MAMGYVAQTSYVVTKESIEKALPGALEEFTDYLESRGTCLDELAASIDLGSDFLELETEEEIKEVKTSLHNFLLYIKEKQNLDIHLGYHNSEEFGSRHDEIDGAYFYVDFEDIYERKPIETDLKIWQKSYVFYC